MSPLPARTRPEGCLSDLRLDRLVGGELAGEAEAETRAHLGSCDRCAARLAEIEAEQAAFLAEGPPLRLPSARPAPRRIGTWAARLAVPLAAAAAIALWLVAKPGPGPVDEGGTRLKGKARIGFYVKRGEAVTLAGPGEVVQPGDALRLSYTTDRAGFLAIVAVDGARMASVYYPAGPRAARIEPGKDAPLDASVVLDDVLGPETAYGLFCSEPIELEPVRAAFQSSPDHPPIPPSCEVDRISYVKRRPPLSP